MIDPGYDGTPIKALFIDLGGVFLTNGWDRNARKEAAEKFGLNLDEMNERHRVIFDSYEAGRTTMKNYLDLLVFYQDRPFTQQEFIDFMYQTSKPFPDMIEMVKNIKRKYNLQIVAVNNEGRELNEYRIHQFKLKEFIDIFASSSFIKVRKPDKEMYELALDLAQVTPKEVVYLDDRQVFIEAAQVLGINGICHKDIATTREGLKRYGLTE